MDYETKKSKKIKVLKGLYDDNFNRNAIGLSDRYDYAEILDDLFSDGLINKSGVIRTKDGPMINDENMTITDKGAQYINPPNDNEPQPKQVFNIHDGNYTNASFGNTGNISYNFDESITELKKLIDALPPTDKTEGEEIVKIIETQNFKPGVFSKFSTFLEKHPNIIRYIGSSIVWTLSNTSRL